MSITMLPPVEKPHPNTRPFGQIYIEADPRAYYEEEMVTGSVYLNLHRHYAKCKLTIEFKGKEKSHFVDKRTIQHGTDDCSYETTEVSEFKSKEKLYESTFTIHNWDDLEIGHHAIPFSIRLPKGLYSSFEVEETRRMDQDIFRASVMYRLTARLVPDVEGLPPLKFKHQINIRATPPKHNLEQSKVLEISRMSLFCWSLAKTFVKIDLERDFASYGEYLPVKLTVDNSQSKIQSEMITIKFFHNLKLKAKTRKFDERILKYKKRFAGVPAGKISQESPINIELLPGQMQSTVDVGLVKSSFELEIWIGDDGCGGPARKCVIPINIGCGNGVYLPPELPRGWNPKQVPVISTVLEKAEDTGFALLEKKKKGGVSATDMISHNNLYKPLLQPEKKHY